MEQSPHHAGSAAVLELEVMDQFAWQEPTRAGDAVSATAASPPSAAPALPQVSFPAPDPPPAPASASAAASPTAPRLRRPHSVATGLGNLPGLSKQSWHSGGSSSCSSAVASVRATPGSEAFAEYKRQRLFENAARGEELPKNAAWSEWKTFSDDKRKRYKHEGEEHRRALDAAALEQARHEEAKSATSALLQKLNEQESSSSSVAAKPKSAASSMLQKLREQESRKPTAADTRERIKQGSAKPTTEKRKGKKAEPEAMPVAVFPQRLGALGATDRADRRREMVGSVRNRTQGNKADISIASSHDVSLADLSARLNAPTLSCDWARRADASDSDAEDSKLEVDMPGDSDSRKWMEDEIQRKISAAKVRRLVQGNEGGS